MNLAEQDIVALGAVVTWRVGDGKVMITVKEQTVMFDASWPLDSKMMMAARNALSNVFTEIQALIVADFAQVKCS